MGSKIVNVDEVVQRVDCKEEIIRKGKMPDYSVVVVDCLVQSKFGFWLVENIDYYTVVYAHNNPLMVVRNDSPIAKLTRGVCQDDFLEGIEQLCCLVHFVE